MSHVCIKLSCDNAAFDPDKSVEVARILRDLADRMDGTTLDLDKVSWILRDLNGNQVGRAVYGPK